MIGKLAHGRETATTLTRKTHPIKRFSLDLLTVRFAHVPIVRTVVAIGRNNMRQPNRPCGGMATSVTESAEFTRLLKLVVGQILDDRLNLHSFTSARNLPSGPHIFSTSPISMQRWAAQRTRGR